MKRFLLLSLAVHALLFLAWPEQAPLRTGVTASQTLELQLAAVNRQDASRNTRVTGRPVTQRDPRPAPASHPQARSGKRTTPSQQAPTTDHAPPETAARSQPPARTPPVTSTEALPAESEHARDRVDAALRSVLRASFSYPRRARLRGWEGTVVIALRILPAGEVCNVRIASSSGIDVLDQAALRALREVRLPQAVAWLDGRQMDMMIPVEYRLTDG